MEHQRVHDEISVDGHHISFSTVGEGPPLMLIPGICQSAERWVQAGYVESLADDFRLILIDPLGHGASEKATDRAAYSRDALTRHLVAVADHLGLDQVAAWGYSRGAQMLSAALVSNPDRFSRAVIGGIPLFDADAVLRDLGLARDEAEYDAAYAKAGEGDWEAYWSVFPLPLPDATKEVLESTNDVRAIAAAAAAGRLEPVVFEITSVPTFAVWGDEEIFHSLNVDTIEGFGADAPAWGTVPGGHAQAFFTWQVEMVDCVRPFLQG